MGLVTDRVQEVYGCGSGADRGRKRQETGDRDGDRQRHRVWSYKTRRFGNRNTSRKQETDHWAGRKGVRKKGETV